MNNKSTVRPNITVPTYNEHDLPGQALEEFITLEGLERQGYTNPLELTAQQQCKLTRMAVAQILGLHIKEWPSSNQLPEKIQVIDNLVKSVLGDWQYRISRSGIFTEVAGALAFAYSGVIITLATPDEDWAGIDFWTYGTESTTVYGVQVKGRDLRKAALRKVPENPNLDMGNISAARLNEMWKTVTAKRNEDTRINKCGLLLLEIPSGRQTDWYSSITGMPAQQTITAVRSKLINFGLLNGYKEGIGY